MYIDSINLTDRVNELFSGFSTFAFGFTGLSTFAFGFKGLSTWFAGLSTSLSLSTTIGSSTWALGYSVWTRLSPRIPIRITLVVT